MIKANTKELELRHKIIKFALLQWHKAYEHGKHGPDTFDCAGFVWFIYNKILNIDLYENGFGLSTTTKIMTSSYGKLTLFDEHSLNKDLTLIQTGDILFFHRQSLKDVLPKENNKFPGHCGIYLEDHKFIHCSKPKSKIVISNFNKSEYWKNLLVASKNVFENNEYIYRLKN